MIAPQERAMTTEDKLKQHVKACPIGWHKGQCLHHRSTTDADVIAWILELERLVGVYQEMDATQTRLPRPYDRSSAFGR